jgi:hypothetical protein
MTDKEGREDVSGEITSASTRADFINDLVSCARNSM